ncbi:hypothetical protein E1293_28420 [Actinomadura darangshiensis]|uniref:Trypsin-co-occurring domain-containing protein n=1 Tax=Actinomadura darangshiensis TaxID=705336 RepID=A0A4V2YU11_9ACTN|nr:CU044_2847 family protein [Actinomadura darangshiensis]TDD75367.1 hypothetical protein E1293_28420 [Actinomadura darangshiensis]
MGEVARYELDDGTRVAFEIVPGDGFRPAGAADVAGRVRDAVDPAVRAARVVLERLKEAAPDEVEVKFGIKVSGKANWVVAKASTDANFEVKLVWRDGPPALVPPEEEPAEEGA